MYNKVGFTDIEASNPHYENILALHDAGIISGYPDGSFKPGQAVTRGQVDLEFMNLMKFDAMTLEIKQEPTRL